MVSSTVDLNNSSYQPRNIRTDNDGYFRIDGLNSGDYLLQTGITVLSSDGKLYETAPVHLEEGKNIGCDANSPLELHFPANGATAYTIFGTVRGDLPSRLGDRFLVALDDAVDLGIHGYKRERKLDANNAFTLKDVPNGNYKLSIYGVYGPEPQQNNRGNFTTMSMPYVELLRHLIATQLIEVRGQDISELELKPMTLPSITGAVYIKHPRTDWKDFKLSDLSVSLIPHRKNGSLSAPLTIKTDDQAEFSIGAADAGEYEVEIESTNPRHVRPKGLYVQSLNLNGKGVNPRFFSLPQEGAVQLEIVLSGETASAHVRVRQDTSFPLPVTALNKQCSPGTSYTVVLFPDPPVSPLIDSEPEQVPHFYLTSSYGSGCVGVPTGVGQNPAGMIMDIPPGSYFAIAARGFDFAYYQFRGWTARQGQMSAEQVRLLRTLETIAKPVTLQAGENVELELSDKTIDASRIAARVGVTDETENFHPQNGQSCCNR